MANTRDRGAVMIARPLAVVRLYSRHGYPCDVVDVRTIPELLRLVARADSSDIVKIQSPRVPAVRFDLR